MGIFLVWTQWAIHGMLKAGHRPRAPKQPKTAMTAGISSLYSRYVDWDEFDFDTFCEDADRRKLEDCDDPEDFRDHPSLSAQQRNPGLK